MLSATPLLVLLLTPQIPVNAGAPAQSPAPIQSAPATKPPSAPPSISDNSFLMEEAYNQDRGVVQHIFTFHRDWRAKTWDASFTQEWPWNPSPRHQLSYTVAGLSAGPGSGSGVGDTLLNWRYQVVSTDRLAVAPRVSAVLPTGDAKRERGAGGAGVDVNLAISVTASDRLVFHSNAGGMVVPHAKADDGSRAAAMGMRFGQSAVWLLVPRVNLLVEAVVSRERITHAPGSVSWENGLTISPGIRWAYNRSGGMQIVPGLAMPIDVHRQRRQGFGIFGYFSVEHPF